MEICLSCGEPARFEIAELCLETREVVLDACCEDNLDGWLDAIRSGSAKQRAGWLLMQAGLAVRDVIVHEGSLSWTLDYGLRLGEVSFAEAREFIRIHHRHCDPPVGWKFGAAVFNGAELVGVMTVGRPVAAALARQACIEINRVCVEDRRPTDLVRNACSMLYGMRAERYSAAAINGSSPTPWRLRKEHLSALLVSDRLQSRAAAPGIGRADLEATRRFWCPRSDGSDGEMDQRCRLRCSSRSQPDCHHSDPLRLCPSSVPNSCSRCCPVLKQIQHGAPAANEPRRESPGPSRCTI
jgi:hypothetical protein